MKMIKEKGYNRILCLIYYFLKSGCNASVSFRKVYICNIMSHTNIMQAEENDLVNILSLQKKSFYGGGRTNE